MQASIRTNIHFISPIYDRLHQNSFSTESFFTELFSQNDHSCIVDIVYKVVEIVLNKILLFLNIFVASVAQRIFV